MVTSEPHFFPYNWDIPFGKHTENELENHHFLWVIQRTKSPFSIVMGHFQVRKL